MTKIVASLAAAAFLVCMPASAQASPIGDRLPRRRKQRVRPVGREHRAVRRRQPRRRAWQQRRLGMRQAHLRRHRRRRQPLPDLQLPRQQVLTPRPEADARRQLGPVSPCPARRGGSGRWRRGPSPVRGTDESSSRVYGCSGASSTSTVGRCSTTTPRRITSTSSQTYRTTARSWLTKTSPTPVCRADVVEQVEHLRLHRDVQGRHGLVEHQHARLDRERAGDRDTLPLTAREPARQRLAPPVDRGRPGPAARPPAGARAAGRARCAAAAPRRCSRRP